MACKLRSEHDSDDAQWFDLTRGTEYCVVIFAWEVDKGTQVKSEGVIEFGNEIWQGQFKDGGLVEGAFKGVKLRVERSRSSDIILLATSKRDMHVTLELRPPGTYGQSSQIGDAYQTISRKGTLAKRISLTTMYCKA